MKKAPIIAAALCALMTTSFAMYVQGEELIYDSQNDPLVSLSYINETVIANYDKKISELTEKISAIAKDNETLKTSNESLQNSLIIANAKVESLEKQLGELKSTPAASTYEVICLKKGQKLLATETCELILRSGSAIVVSITANGINDSTNGTELMNAAPVPLYHSLLIPRGGDGRGIEVTADEAYIMVRGGHEIVG